MDMIGNKSISTKAVQPRSALNLRIPDSRPAVASNAVAGRSGMETIGRARAMEQSNAEPRSSLMFNLSEAVAIDASVARFEVIAGRSAMLGFAVTILDELTTQSSVFTMSTIQTTQFGAMMVLLLGSAVTLAVGQFTNPNTNATTGMALLAKVIATLTSRRDSYEEREVSLSVAIDRYLVEGGDIPSLNRVVLADTAADV